MPPFTPAETFDPLFRRQVERSPAAIAVSFREQQLTYADLDGLVNRWAAVLLERGAGPEHVVALLSERTPELLAAILAVFRVGAAYVPLDPRDPAERHARILTQSGARLVLAAPTLVQATGSCAPRGVDVVPLEPGLLRATAGAEAAASSAPPPGPLPPAPNAPGNLAYVIFTSGSTGEPKGAMLEQRGLVNHLWAMIAHLELGERDVIAQTGSQCFDLSIWQMLAMLLVGGRTAMLPDEVANQPAALLRALEAERVTVVELVPSVLRTVCASAARRGDRRPQLAALRWMMSTGEALPASLCSSWFGLYPRIPLINAYGPTECSDDVALHFLFEPPLDGDAVPVGIPIANVQVYILDQRLQPLPTDAAGQLFVGGVGIGRGYVADPVRTAQAFLPDPFSEIPGARMYCTGDLAVRHHDGLLEYQGRIDQQIKLRGLRIELGEVEAAVASHPAVLEGVVKAIVQPSGDSYLAAYVTLRSQVPVAELLAHVITRLPAYMVPAVIVPLEQMPLTAAGKVDRRALPNPDASTS